MKNIIIKLLFIIVVCLVIFASRGISIFIISICLIAGSVLILHYKKGLEKLALMKKFKKYLTRVGYFIFLISIFFIISGILLCISPFILPSHDFDMHFLGFLKFTDNVNMIIIFIYGIIFIGSGIGILLKNKLCYFIIMGFLILDFINCILNFIFQYETNELYTIVMDLILFLLLYYQRNNIIQKKDKKIIPHHHPKGR